MKTMTYALMCACLTVAAGSAAAQDPMKKSDATTMRKDPTMQECKDHIAMSKDHGMKKDGMKHDGMKKDEAAMKMDKFCADMMMKNEGSMKKDIPTDPMKR